MNIKYSSIVTSTIAWKFCTELYFHSSSKTDTDLWIWQVIKVRVKDVPEHFTKAYRGSRGTPPHMNHGAARWRLDNNTPQPL
jgi:hypothetical protein